MKAEPATSHTGDMTPHQAIYWQAMNIYEPLDSNPTRRVVPIVDHYATARAVSKAILQCQA